MSYQHQDQDQVKISYPNPNPKFKLARDPRALTILEFIKSNESESDTTGITMDKVAKYMNEKGICSRPTTRLLLFSLLEEGILLEKKRRNTYFHDLVINEDYSFEGLLIEIFLDHVEDLKESLRPFNILIKDKKILTNHAVTKNAKEVLLTISISNLNEAQEIYTRKQMEKIQSDIQNKQKRLNPPTKIKAKTRRK